jgi:hypothetical protein
MIHIRRSSAQVQANWRQQAGKNCVGYRAENAMFIALFRIDIS